MKPLFAKPSQITLVKDWRPDDDHPVGGDQRDHIVHGEHLRRVGVQPWSWSCSHPGVHRPTSPCHVLHWGPQVSSWPNHSQLWERAFLCAPLLAANVKGKKPFYSRYERRLKSETENVTLLPEKLKLPPFLKCLVNLLNINIEQTPLIIYRSVTGQLAKVGH